MGTARRVLWATVLLAFPADVAIRVIWEPPWGGDLADWLAPAASLLGAGLLLRQSALPRLRDARHSRDIKGLRVDVEALRAQLDEHETMAAAEIAETRDRLDDLSAGVVRVFGATGRTVPDPIAADAPTQPHLRRVV